MWKYENVQMLSVYFSLKSVTRQTPLPALTLGRLRVEKIDAKKAFAHFHISTFLL
jgi:hypothetical protein